MAAKRRPQPKTSTRGPRGKTGASGPAGPAGPPGQNHTNEIAVLSAQVAQLVKELQVQLTRIAQIQAQMDHLAMGQARPVPSESARTGN